MINTIKLYENGYTVKYSDGRNHSINGVLAESEDEEVQEWLLANTPEPEFTPEELLAQDQAEFRSQRDELIKEADIEIYKLEDINADTTAWRAYRQALRDSTLTWVLPTKPVGV